MQSFPPMLLFLPAIVLALLAYGVTAGLWPAARSRRGLIAFALTALVIHAAWLITMRVMHGGTGPLVFLIRALAGTWTVAAIACVLIGGPVLLVRSLLRLSRLGINRLRTSPLPSSELEEPATSEPSTAAALQLDRRAFLQGAAVPTIAVFAGAGGTLNGMKGFVIRNQQVVVPGLPRELDGFRIGQISDVHVGAYIDVGHLGRAVDALNESQANLHVMTGDLIDDVYLLEETFAQLERSRARHGMLAILGNHEKRRSVLPEVLRAYDRSAVNRRVRLLVDENMRLDHEGAPLQIVGVDYPMRPGNNHMLPKPERDLVMRRSAEAAFSGVSREVPTLCLSHHPDFFPIAAERGAALTLAGHTHGGQIAWDGRPIVSSYQYMLGRYQLGNSHLYVSGGTGHWIPFRVGVPAEVTILTLKSG